MEFAEWQNPPEEANARGSATGLAFAEWSQMKIRALWQTGLKALSAGAAKLNCIDRIKKLTAFERYVAVPIIVTFCGLLLFALYGEMVRMQANAVAVKQEAEVAAREKAEAVAREVALQESNAAADAASGIKAGREYDILKSVELRAGPGEDQPRKVNQKASDLLREIHYLSVDSSVTVQVHQTKDLWADVQVTQPSFLTASHRGWIPIDCIQVGASSTKRDGWIRHTCFVYAGKSTNSATVGYLSPPSSVGVADDNSGWLRLIHGPIKIEGTQSFVDNPDFDGGVYIEASNFTTVIPGKWNK